MSFQATPSNSHIVAIYDGKCSLCANFAKAVRNSLPASMIDVIPCGSEIQKKIAPTVDASTCEQDFMVLYDDGTILKGHDAVVHIVNLVPSLRKHPWIMKSKPASLFTKTVYKLAGIIRKILRRLKD